MSVWYEVKVTTVKVVLVEVKQEETWTLTKAAALDAVLETHITDGSMEAEIDGGPYTADTPTWESVKRHADEVLPL